MRIYSALSVLLLAILSVSVVFAATEKEIADYPYHAEVFEEFNYDWRTYKVQTEDGWILTVFRVWREEKLDASKLPLFLVHGSMDSSLGFFAKSSDNDAWCL